MREAGVVVLNPKDGVKLRLAARICIAVSLVASGCDIFDALCSAGLGRLSLYAAAEKVGSIASAAKALTDSKPSNAKCVRENYSFAPLGLACVSLFPRLAPWAVFLRRFAAAETSSEQDQQQRQEQLQRRRTRVSALYGQIDCILSFLQVEDVKGCKVPLLFAFPRAIGASVD